MFAQCPGEFTSTRLISSNIFTNIDTITRDTGICTKTIKTKYCNYIASTVSFSLTLLASYILVDCCTTVCSFANTIARFNDREWRECQEKMRY